jgi:hypothetical protein
VEGGAREREEEEEGRGEAKGASGGGGGGEEGGGDEARRELGMHVWFLHQRGGVELEAMAAKIFQREKKRLAKIDHEQNHRRDRGGTARGRKKKREKNETKNKTQNRLRVNQTRGFWFLDTDQIKAAAACG